MAVHASTVARARVRTRIALGTTLRVVPPALIRVAREHHVLVPVLRHRTISDIGPFVVSGGAGARLLAVDAHLARILYWYGSNGYEAYEAYWWQRFCEASSGILEVGANIGYYTVLGALAAPKTPYTAVEANPQSAEIARRNLELNEISHVRLVPAAAVDDDTADDEVQLALPQLEVYEAPTGAFLRGRTEGVDGRRAVGATLVVPTVKASSLVPGIDLLKLDIEGTEHLFLKSTINQLVANRSIILVEVLRDTPELRALLASLASEDYQFCLAAGPELKEVGKEALEAADLLHEYGSRDLAVVPKERMGAFAA